jgi:ATP synthase protein I
MEPTDSNNERLLSQRIEQMEKRKLKAQRENKGVWFGLGMFGMVGWSVAVPAVLGALLGLWLDKTHPVPFSWTLSLLIIGLIAGCLIAWYWVASEDKKMHQTDDE